MYFYIQKMKKRLKPFLFILVSFFTLSFSSCGNSEQPKSVPVSQFAFSLADTFIEKGNQTNITNVYIFPATATDQRIQYWSEDPSIASLDGLTISGLKKGTTNICGRTMDGSNIEYKVNLTVNDNSEILVNDIQLIISPSTFTIGDSFTPMINVLPGNASNKEYDIIASNDNVSISLDDKITCLKKGKTTIKAVAKDSGKKESNNIEITINDVPEILVNSIALNISPLTYIVGDKVAAQVSVMPSTAFNKDYDFVASNDCVEINGHEITCVKGGSVSIKAVAKDKGKVESNSINIEIENKYVERISLYSDKTRLYPNNTTQIEVIYDPIDAFDKGVVFTTESGTNDVISVSSSGLVTAINKGSDTVIATLISNPLIKTEIEFSVVLIEPTSITINLPTSVYAGETYLATATVLPSDAYSTTPIFSITDGNDIASISEDGLLIVYKGGDFKVHVYLKEKPSITNDLIISSIYGGRPTDPFEDDIF